MASVERAVETLPPSPKLKQATKSQPQGAGRPKQVGDITAIRSAVGRSGVSPDLLLSLQASHGNAAVQELLEPVQRAPAGQVAPHKAPARHHQSSRKAAHHDVPAARSSVINPTYQEAHDHVEKYFRRQAEKATVLAELKDHAVGKFKEVTGEAFNTEAPGGLEILWGVLQIVPTAGPLLTACSELKDGAKVMITIKELGEEATKLGESVEKAKKIVEPVKSGYELVTKGSEATEKHESAEFVIEKINSLDELRVADVTSRWKKEDVVDNLLKAHKHDPAKVDLLGQMEKQLPIDEASDLKQAAEEVQTKFELALYADFYRKKGAKWVIMSVFIRGEFLDGIPTPAKEYMKKLGHFASDRELASEFRLPIFRDISPVRGDTNYGTEA